MDVADGASITDSCQNGRFQYVRILVPFFATFIMIFARLCQNFCQKQTKATRWLSKKLRHNWLRQSSNLYRSKFSLWI